MRTLFLSHNESKTNRQNGGSALSAAAYAARDRAYEERTGRHFDHTPEGQREALRLLGAGGKGIDLGGVTLSEAELKDDLVHIDMVVPDGAPAWMRDWRSAFDRAETTETGKAPVALKGNVLLPLEFGIDDAIEAAHRFAERKFLPLKMACQVAVHWRDGQPHFHYVATARQVTARGFGSLATWADAAHKGAKKYANPIVWLHNRAVAPWHRETRRIGADQINAVAIEQGHEVRVEARSFRDLDLKFLRELPVGPGQSNARAALNDVRAEANAELAMGDPSQLVREVFANTGTVTEGVLKSAVGRRCRDDVAFQTVWRALTEEGHVVRLGMNPRGDVVYSSPAFVLQETRLVETANTLVGRNAGSSDQERHRLQSVVDGYQADKGFKLKDEQRRAVEHALFGGDLTMIQGLPGTGKTTAMEVCRRYVDAVREDAERLGKEAPIRIRGAAIAAVAAENLERESGIPSSTVARIVHDYRVAEAARAVLSRDDALPRERARAELDLREAEMTALRPGDRLIVDEAGMVPTEDLALLASKAAEVSAAAAAEPGHDGADRSVRICLVGDHEQLSAVGAGGGFRLLIESYGAVTLEDITRQKDAGDREASKALVRGDIQSAVMHYYRKGQVHFADTKSDGIKALVDRYIELRDQNGAAEVLVTAGRNSDIDRINAAVRTIRMQRGELGEQHQVYGLTLSVGDEVMVQENSKRLGTMPGQVKAVGVKNGERAVVRGLLRDDKGDLSSVVLEKLGPDGKPDGRLIYFSATDPLRIRHAYAITVHKSQGQTRDHCLHYGGGESRTLGLVGGTRHRYSYEIFADRETYPDDLRDLIREMSADGRQENLLDYHATPERRPFYDAVARYHATSASYNVAAAARNPNKEQVAKLAAERQALASAIVGTADMPEKERDAIWAKHRQFAAQARLDRWSLEEGAGVRERLRSIREERAERTVENFVRLHRDAGALWSEIRKTHGKNPQEHPDYPRLAALVLIRGREASLMTADRKLYGPLVESAGLTWGSVRSFATRHRALEKSERRAAVLDEQALARFRQVVAEIGQLARSANASEARERREELMAEAKRTAVELQDAGLTRDDLPVSDKASRNFFHSFTEAARVSERAMAQGMTATAGRDAAADMTDTVYSTETTMPDAAPNFSQNPEHLGGRAGGLANEKPPPEAEIDVDALHARLSPKTLELLHGGPDAEVRKTQVKVLAGLARDGLTLDEAIAVAEARGGGWRTAIHGQNNGVGFRADMARIWLKYNFEREYAGVRARFHEVPAEQEMSRVVYADVPSEAYTTAGQSWADQEQAAEEVAARAGVVIDPQPVPPNPAERLVTRGEELIAAVRGRMIEVPVDRNAALVEMVRAAEEARASRVGQLSRSEASELGRPVLRSKGDWAAELLKDRERRIAQQPRVAPADLSPRLQEVHAKALEASHLDGWEYAKIAGRVKNRESFLNMFHISRRLNTVNTKQAVTPLQVKQAVFRKEMKAYEESLYRSGISREDRHQLVVREAKQRAAEWGMDYDVARSALSSVQQRAFKQAARHEARVAKLAAGIEADGIRFGRKPRARDLSDLTPEEAKAHEAAVARVDAIKVDVAGIVSDLERARAFNTAQAGQPTDQARGRVAMTKAEVAWAVAGEQTRIYAQVLTEAGLPQESVQRMADREAIHRAKLLGYGAEEIIRRNVETNYAASAHNSHRDRLDSLGAAIAAGRGEGGDRFAQYDLTDSERQAHERALTASRLTAAEIAGVVQGCEIEQVREKAGSPLEGRDFFAAWDKETLSADHAREVVLELEMQRYSSLLRDQGVMGLKADEMVEREWVQRAAELGLSSRDDRIRAADELGLGREDSVAHYHRHELMAWAVISREPATGSFERSARMTEPEVLKLAGEMEYAAREAYAKEHGVTLGEASRVVQITTEDLKAAVAEVEAARVAWREQDAERAKAAEAARNAGKTVDEAERPVKASEMQSLAEQRDPHREVPTAADIARDALAEKPFNRDVERFVQLAAMVNERDVTREGPARGTLQGEAKALAERILRSERAAGGNGKEEREEAFAKNPAADRLFKVAERDIAQAERDRAAGKSVVTARVKGYDAGYERD